MKMRLLAIAYETFLNQGCLVEKLACPFKVIIEIEDIQRRLLFYIYFYNKRFSLVLALVWIILKKCKYIFCKLAYLQSPLKMSFQTKTQKFKGLASNILVVNFDVLSWVSIRNKLLVWGLKNNYLLQRVSILPSMPWHPNPVNKCAHF